MEYKPKSRRADDSLLRVNRKGLSVQRSVGPDLSYRRAPLLPNPHVSPRQLHLQRTEKQLTDFTVSPLTAQRQVLAPVFKGIQLQRELLNTAGSGLQRESLQRQIEGHQASLGASGLQAGQYEASVQRQADLQTPVAPLTQRPSTPAQWSQGGLWEVQRVADPSKAGQTISLREHEQSQHLGMLRTVGTQLGQGFRADTGPATQRYAEYGEALAPFQRLGTGTGRAMVTTALMQVPVSQRSALQRAIDETIQRQQAQETQDRAIIQLHSLQRQLEHLDCQGEQPVMEQIQARRGSGNPLPTPLKKALELELNHDLSRVRLHDDAEADHLSKKVNAVAFTTGQDIFFRAGTFNPNTRTGVELIAHEVKHTKQQAQGTAKPGIDGDAGQEHDARSFGASFAAGHFVGPTARLSQGKRQSGRSPASQHAAGWAVQRRAEPTPVTSPKVLPTGGKLAVIRHLDGANLHASPHGSGPTSALLPLGTKLSELSKTPDGWSRVVTAQGQQGYVQSLRLTTDLPDAGASLVKVEAGTTAIGIAERYYKALVKPGQDLRFYVNVLQDLDQRRGTGAFQSGQTLKAGQALWVPGPALAQSLVGQVGSGSLTGGMWARAKKTIGNGPGANILRSVLESPQYITEVLGELWAQVKEHWALILGTTAALVGAELLVGALAAAPEPTTITKFLAVGLQGLITAIAGAGLAIGVAQATIAGTRWLMQAWDAKGDAGKLKAASKAFLSMVGNLVVAVASVAGVRASVIKTGQVASLVTKEQLIAQIGSKATYDALMNILKSQGVKKSTAQILGALLKRVPDPTELQGFLRNVDKPERLMALLDLYSLPALRRLMALKISNRHILGSLSIPKATGNTLFLGTRAQAAAELAEIKSGAAVRNGDEFITSSGRTWGIHEGSVHPIRGPQTIDVTSPEYKILVQVQKGEMENALRTLEVLKSKGLLTPEQSQRTLDLIQLMRNGK